MSEYFNPDVMQHDIDTCAIKSQQLIMEDFGIACSEEELVQIAMERGWYNGGTAPEDVGNLLEWANIPCSRHTDANVFNLVSELAQGHKVIVGLDSDELWKDDSPFEKLRNWFHDCFGDEQGDHALIVAGIDTSDPNNVQVIVRDPGTGDDGKPYPLDQFMEAWSDAHCYMVSTDLSAPKHSLGMENFDTGIGHIPEVAGVNYYDFELFNNISMGLPISPIIEDFMPYAPFEPQSLVPMMQPMTFTPFDPATQVTPMTSLMHAYFDYANNQIAFNDIFSPQYAFNNYLDCSLVNEYMRPTCFDGFNQIGWENIQPMGYDLPMDFSPQYLGNMGLDYSLFYNDSMTRFAAMGDFDSMQLCQQQLDIMGYCDSKDMDYTMDFLMFG